MLTYEAAVSKYFWPKASISGDTGSEKAVRWAQARLNSCLSDHGLCPQYTESPLPTRILDICFQQGDLTADIRLHEPNNESATYACLSYCWGTDHHFKTMESNLQDRKTCIKWTDIPRTLQDVIIFTRRLHIRYLWIDCLCIIQDNEDDWQKEAAAMSSIYERAILTLAASHAANVDAGCFNTSSPLAVGCEIHGQFESREPHNAHNQSNHSYPSLSAFQRISPQGAFETLHVRQLLDHPGFNEEVLSKAPLPPLFDRGWAYQERVLSPRILHFCSEELVWECAELTRCECQRLDVELNSYSPSKLRSIRAIQSSDDRLELFRTMVREYSKLKLTRAEDKLPAIAGVARQFRASAEDKYLSGLWQSSLINTLDWHTWNYSTTTKPLGRSEVWVAPTWSWASVPGRIHYFPDIAGGIKFSREPRCEILSAEAKSVGPDMFGKCSYGHLILCGSLVSVRLRCKFQLTDYEVEPGLWSCHDPIQFEIRRLHSERGFDIHLDLDSTFYLNCFPWRPVVSTSEPGYVQEVREAEQELHCFLVAEDFFLVLERANASEHVYERIGIGYFFKYRDSPEFLFDTAENTKIKII